MAKLKLDFKQIKQTLSSRLEILGLVVAVVLVSVCLVWGISTLLGATSPVPAMEADKARLDKLRKEAPRMEKPKEAKGKKPTDWPPVDLAPPKWALYPVFEQGGAGSTLRVSPKILLADGNFQIDYLHKGVHTVQPASAPDSV